jgi:16S rRNA (guanine1516-N2)-methyltransferase
MSADIAILKPPAELFDQAFALSKRLGLPLINAKEQDQFSAVLLLTTQHLAIQLCGADAPGPVSVDYLSGKAAHRRKYGGGKGQLLAKAIGLGTLKSPRVLDLTAGLGQDAFVMACLGCDVQMIERSPIIGALVEDALARAEVDTSFATLKLKLRVADSHEYLQMLTADNYPDVIYLDPMFPTRTKSALVKKEMRVLRVVVGEDVDSENLLTLSRKIAKKRVVVKRPRLAPHLNNQTPDVIYRGESSRFDVYLHKAPSLES